MMNGKFVKDYYDIRPYEKGRLAQCKQCRYKHNDNGPSDSPYLLNHLKERHPEHYKEFCEKTSKDTMESIVSII
jgi:predicted metal-binding protein